MSGLSKQESIIIAPESGWRSINWRELVAYKDLLLFLVWRDIKARYAQTVIGLGWAVIRPVFSMVVFTIVFGGLANVPSDGTPYAIFSYAALVPWTYFAGSMNASTASLVTSSGIITKVYFPRLIIPMTPVVAGLVDFSIASGILGVLMIYYKIAPTGWIVAIPFLIVLTILTSMGIGMWLSALALQYRDVRNGTEFLSQLLMYAAPVVWPVSLITERFPVWGETIRLIYGLYPMAGVIEGFRSALLGSRPMPWDLIGMGTVSALILLVSGAFYFKRMEPVFADVA